MIVVGGVGYFGLCRALREFLEESGKPEPGDRPGFFLRENMNAGEPVANRVVLISVPDRTPALVPIGPGVPLARADFATRTMGSSRGTNTPQQRRVQGSWSGNAKPKPRAKPDGGIQGGMPDGVGGPGVKAS